MAQSANILKISIFVVDEKGIYRNIRLSNECERYGVGILHFNQR